MPVSTRSPDSSQEPKAATNLRNHHHGLKEKMKALTLLYEQHQQLALSPKTHPHPPPVQPESRILATHYASAELLDLGCKKKGDRSQEEELEITKRPIAYPRNNEKENHDINVSDRIAVYSCLKKLPFPALSTRRLSEGMAVRAKTMEVGPVVESRENGSRILVFVRLRPMSKKEKEGGARTCVRITNRRDVYLTGLASETDYLRLKRIQGRHFCFDASFIESTTQQEVYSTTTAELVEGVLQGRNGTVFCYGATGAGKTYTMLGTMENPGVMVLAIKDLFFKIRQRSYNGNHSVYLSYLEVYNESVRDLLAPGRPLVLREDKQGTVAAGLTQYRAYTTEEVMALLQQGNRNRTTEPTRVNETSSRSHAILQTCTANEEVITAVPETETDQAKLVLELQKENSKLRQQLMRQQQKLLTLQAQTLALNSSPPPSVPSSSPLLSPSHSAAQKAKCFILSGNCFGTPPPSLTTVKALEAEIERLKKEHALELKQKDEFIKELMLGRERMQAVTRAKASMGERNVAGGELKSPSHRFASPVVGTKKRSFWDIGGGGAGGGSPLISGRNGRNTRSQVEPETPPAPSMLLQPGFARRRTDSTRL